MIDHTIANASSMLNANKAASVTNFTVVILDIAVVEAWDPGVGRK